MPSRATAAIGSKSASEGGRTVCTTGTGTTGTTPDPRTAPSASSTLNFIRNDIGIGFGVTSLVRADSCHACFDPGTTQALTSILVTARWYPVRRLTPSRSVEPYVTAGVGPVFGVDTAYALDHDGRWHHDGYASTHVGTTFGGRVGGGVDFRLGRTFTMGLGGAWNWDAGFSGDLWRAPRPNGGEFTVSFGWNFGK